MDEENKMQKLLDEIDQLKKTKTDLDNENTELKITYNTQRLEMQEALKRALASYETEQEEHLKTFKMKDEWRIRSFEKSKQIEHLKHQKSNEENEKKKAIQKMEEIKKEQEEFKEKHQQIANEYFQTLEARKKEIDFLKLAKDTKAQEQFIHSKNINLDFLNNKPFLHKFIEHKRPPASMITRENLEARIQELAPMYPQLYPLLDPNLDKNTRKFILYNYLGIEV